MSLRRYTGLGSWQWLALASLAAAISAAVRRILDPEQRRKGHEAWKAEQRVRARGVPYVCEEGRKHPAERKEGAVFINAAGTYHEWRGSRWVEVDVVEDALRAGTITRKTLRKDAEPDWRAVYDRHCPPGFRVEWDGRSVDGLRLVPGTRLERENEATREWWAMRRKRLSDTLRFRARSKTLRKDGGA